MRLTARKGVIYGNAGGLPPIESTELTSGGAVADRGLFWFQGYIFYKEVGEAGVDRFKSKGSEINLETGRLHSGL
jgi:hypothetical protein